MRSLFCADPVRVPPPVTSKRSAGIASFVLQPAVWAALPNALVGLGLAFLLTDRQLAMLVHDDAFYYLTIARHIARGDGVTFDGLQPTDGFQPLWMAILAVLAWCVPWHGARAIRTVLCVHGALTVCTAVIADRLLRSVGVGSSGRVIAEAILVPLLAAMDIGMESALWTCCTVAMLDAIVQRRAPWWQATTVVLVGLARSDAAPLPITLAMAFAWRAAVAKRSLQGIPWWALVAVASPLAATLGRYLCAGHVVSIAASLKTQLGGILRFNWLAHAAWGIRIRLLAGVSVSVAAAPTLVVGSRNDSALGRLDTGLLGAGVFVLAQAVGLLLLSVGGVGSWYFGAPLTLALLMAVRVVGSRCNGRVGAVVCIAAACSFAALLSRRLILRPDRQAQIAVAAWLRHNTAPDAVILQNDGGGAVGWYAQRHVIDGDGLVGSWGYQHALDTGSVPAWIAAAGVTWVVTDSLPTATGIHLFLRRWHGPDVVLGAVDPARASYCAGRYCIVRASVFGLGTPPHV